MEKKKPVVIVVGPGRAWRLSVVTALQRDGYVTLEANDGFGALQSAMDNRIDLLISGDEMEGLTGREMIGVIRRHDAIPHCILISESPEGAAGLPDHVEFVGAPFETEELLSKARGRIADRRAGTRRPAGIACGGETYGRPMTDIMTET